MNNSSKSPHSEEKRDDIQSLYYFFSFFFIAWFNFFVFCAKYLSMFICKREQVVYNMLETLPEKKNREIRLRAKKE